MVVASDHERSEREFQLRAERIYGILKKAIEPEVFEAIKTDQHQLAVVASITVMLELAGELEAWLNEACHSERNPIETIYETYTHGYNHGFQRVRELTDVCRRCPQITICVQQHIVNCPHEHGHTEALDAKH